MVGLTGPPGAGKSTIIAALVKARRAHDRKVAVLSIDPSSPFTQGAVLGDRIRLTEHFLDPACSSGRWPTGAPSAAWPRRRCRRRCSWTPRARRRLPRDGRRRPGRGRHHRPRRHRRARAHPGSGDSVQALKAGVMEIPDVIVVNKADHPLTDTMVREVRGVLSLAPQAKGAWRVPIVKTEMSRGEGVPELLERLDEHRAYIEAEGTLSERRRRNLRNEVLGICTYRLRRRLEAALAEESDFAALLDEVVARRIDPASAATTLLERVDAAGAAPRAT
jgi:LAO/AO transport system kinase